MSALRLGIVFCLIAGQAGAQVSIAPGNPGTVGQGGALRGVVPGEAVPAPKGAMETFGITRPNTDAPFRGANSFTEGEARRRLERNGFTDVTGLARDADGIWRGKAKRSGASVDVYCDYQGNVGAS